MPVGGTQQLIRRVVCVRGEMRFDVECEPRFNYARDEHEVVVAGQGALFRCSSQTLALSASVPLLGTETGVAGRFTLATGETAVFVLQAVAEEAIPEPLSGDGAQEVEAARTQDSNSPPTLTPPPGTNMAS